MNDKPDEAELDRAEQARLKEIEEIEKLRDRRRASLQDTRQLREDIVRLRRWQALDEDASTNDLPKGRGR